MCNLRGRAPDDFPIVFVVVDGMDGLVLELVRSDLEIVRVGEPIERDGESARDFYRVDRQVKGTGNYTHHRCDLIIGNQV